MCISFLIPPLTPTTMLIEKKFTLAKKGFGRIWRYIIKMSNMIELSNYSGSV